VKQQPPAELRFRVGVDAVRAQRLQEVIFGDEARQRAVFTERELDHCRGRRREYEHLAARFAAKEAVLKTFGTGLTRRMRFTEVEVVNEQSGRPRIELGGTVAEFAREHGLQQLDVSLTHTDGLAVATAIAAWEQRCAST
jgi:holo-[acyl-carrier protein] synthase